MPAMNIKDTIPGILLVKEPVRLVPFKHVTAYFPETDPGCAQYPVRKFFVFVMIMANDIYRYFLYYLLTENQWPLLIR